MINRIFRIYKMVFIL